MRFLIVVASALSLLLPSLAHASVGGARLLEESLSAPISLGAPRASVALDDGSGGGAGAYLLEACASIATEFTTALLLGVALGVGLVASGGSEAAIAGTLAVTLVGITLVPLVTSAVVYGIARAFGDQPSYGRIVLFSYAARVSFGLLGLIVGPEAATGLSVVGLFAGAIAEVYAANTGSVGSGGDVPARDRFVPDVRPVSTQLEGPRREDRAVWSLAMAF